jgi:hypothetical protein
MRISPRCFHTCLFVLLSCIREMTILPIGVTKVFINPNLLWIMLLTNWAG